MGFRVEGPTCGPELTFQGRVQLPTVEAGAPQVQPEMTPKGLQGGDVDGPHCTRTSAASTWLAAGTRCMRSNICSVVVSAFKASPVSLTLKVESFCCADVSGFLVDL